MNLYTIQAGLLIIIIITIIENVVFGGGVHIKMNIHGELVGVFNHRPYIFITVV